MTIGFGLEVNGREPGEEEALVAGLLRAQRNPSLPPSVMLDVRQSLDLIRAALGGNASAGPARAGAPAAVAPPCAHSADFASVRWLGATYRFTKLQAACVRVLWEAQENGTPVLAEETIGEKAGSGADVFRLDHAFRDARTGERHAAWGTMIVAAGRGHYRLAPRNP